MVENVATRAVPNIRFEFEPDRIVGQMDYSYSAEYCHDLEPEYGQLITVHAAMPHHGRVMKHSN